MWTGSNWLAPEGIQGPNGVVNALALNPLGGPSLVAGGSFSMADICDCRNVGELFVDGDGMMQWSPFAMGTDSTVNALAVRNGHVFVGGQFTNAVNDAGGNVSGTGFIAEWTGTQWSSLGGGMDSNVNVIYKRIGGAMNIVAGGDFTAAGTITNANRIAKWNGTTWSTFGSGASSGVNSSVFALAELGNSELEVGGVFSAAGGKAVGNFARWSDTGMPRIIIQPSAGMHPCAGVGGMITVFVVVDSDYDFGGPLVYQWTRTDAVGVHPVVNGAGGASLGGGTVIGADTDTLKITNFQASDAGGYKVTVSNSCSLSGVVSSTSFIGFTCPADHNGDCTVAPQDIFDFLSDWFQLCGNTLPLPATCHASADINGVDGVTVQDIFDFLSAWFLGCH